MGVGGEGAKTGMKNPNQIGVGLGWACLGIGMDWIDLGQLGVAN